MTTRRQFLRLLALGGSATLVAACSTPLLVPSATSLASLGTQPSLATGLPHSPAPQPAGGSSFVDVAVDSIRVNPENQRRVLLLQEVGSRRYLPVWIGHSAADAIAIPMQQIPVSRPLSHALMLDLVTATGSRVHEVRIERVDREADEDADDEAFSATIILATAAGMRAVDARPSDAVALALRAGVPIRVATDVLDAAGLGFEAPAESPEEQAGDPTDRDRPLEAAREGTLIEPAAGPDLDMECVEAEVDSIRVNRTNRRRVVILKDKTSRRKVPIWTGHSEADAIWIAMHRVPVTRPLIHPLMLDLLQAAGSRVREARIDRLSDESFEGSVVLETAQGTRAVLARPSDGIALALYASAPIKVATMVMQQAGLLFECDPAEEPDDPDAEPPGSGAAPPPIRVLVVAAESQERQRLYSTLKRRYPVTPMRVGASPDIAVVGGARTGAEALRLLRERRPDVVLVNTELPDMSGVDLCQRLCDAHPGVAVAMLAGSAEAEVVRACVRAGARGYLLPSRLPDGFPDWTFVLAVRALALGQAVFAPRAVVPLLNPARWDDTSGDIRLSLNRWQREVLRLIARGHSDQEIGELRQPDQLSEGARAVHRSQREVQRLRERMSARDIAERLQLSQSTLTELRREIAEWSRARWQPLVLGLEVVDEVRRSGWAQSTVEG